MRQPRRGDKLKLGGVLKTGEASTAGGGVRGGVPTAMPTGVSRPRDSGDRVGLNEGRVQHQVRRDVEGARIFINTQAVAEV